MKEFVERLNKCGLVGLPDVNSLDGAGLLPLWPSEAGMKSAWGDQP
ncbi:MAG TPA: hypothetical protein VJS64_19485 [Pyrinomonadaceae bacterium]|nr:hypothetical protein [Pyrinomonadaceae bacterium]